MQNHSLISVYIYIGLVWDVLINYLMNYCLRNMCRACASLFDQAGNCARQRNTNSVSAGINFKLISDAERFNVWTNYFVRARAAADGLREIYRRPYS